MAEIAGVVSSRSTKTQRHRQGHRSTIDNGADGDQELPTIPFVLRVSRVMPTATVSRRAHPADRRRRCTRRTSCAIRGPAAPCTNYLIKEVQKVYRQQGVDINDKHIEVIVRQMMRKVRVEDAGDAEVLPGSVMDRLEFEDYNNADRRRASTPAKRV